MAKTLYRLFVRLYPVAIKMVTPFNQKARLWVKGRKGVFERMRQAIREDDKVIWIHCSSLGEFEQGRPLIERMRQVYPFYKILITFFSPSGYEVRKDYNGADYIFYLPADSQKNAKTFYGVVKPRLVVFVKYEFWYYYLAEAKNRNVPLLLISAIFRKTQPFFSKGGGFHQSMLSCFTHLFVQNKESVDLLEKIGFASNVTVAGDTRFDRVIEIAEGFKSIPSIEAFCKNSNVIVAGSTWLEDDKELAHYTKKRTNVKFIIAPHNIGKDRLKECLRLYKHPALFSSVKDGTAAANINTMIIDNVGMLSRLYKYATVCYVGGGFGAEGVHNLLEAAVYGRPVVFGPVYAKFNEAVELIERGGGLSIENALQLEMALDDLLKDKRLYTEKANAARDYVYSKRGSTDKIMRFIYENRLLTN